ncbi:MAG: hypothetical protein R2809_12360 [Flavobacteriales bacterium]
MLTLDSLQVIQEMVPRKMSLDEKNEGRKKFRSQFKPLVVEEININGIDKAQGYYIRKMMGRNKSAIPLDQLKPTYFRIFSDDKIKSIFPQLEFNRESNRFKMKLDVEKERDLFVSFGGNFSSRSINTGFVGLKYNLFGKTSATLSANSYFGRFYASLHGDVRWDLPGTFPFSLSGSFTQNRWDYYKSLTTFFDDTNHHLCC